jgi:hypothetical protein
MTQLQQLKNDRDLLLFWARNAARSSLDKNCLQKLTEHINRTNHMDKSFNTDGSVDSHTWYHANCIRCYLESLQLSYKALEKEDSK